MSCVSDSDDLRNATWLGRAVALAVENVEQGGAPFEAWTAKGDRVPY
jgi:hypothetical protein